MYALLYDTFSQSIIHFFIANLAQLVEQLIRNEQVAGSIPAVGSGLWEAEKIGRHEMGFPTNK